MVTTVTTSTVTTVTTMIGFGAAMGVMAVIALLTFLCIRQLAAVSKGDSHRFLARSLDVGIVPLFIAFIMIVAVKILEILA